MNWPICMSSRELWESVRAMALAIMLLTTLVEGGAMEEHLAPGSSLPSPALRLGRSREEAAYSGSRIRW